LPNLEQEKDKVAILTPKGPLFPLGDKMDFG